MTIDPFPSATPPLARIRAHTHRQAMDWSLVLASQGIEHGIERAEDGGRFLVVPTQEYQRAAEAIRLYRLENRRWPWRRMIPKTGAVFDWASAAWVLLTVVFYWLEVTRENFRDLGTLDSAAMTHGEWWRLFTATLLHADLAHLAMNAAFGFVLIGLAMGRFGTGVGLLAAYLAGVAGNVTAWLLYGEPHRGLGASGVVMGALGLVAAQSVSLLKNNPHAVKLAISGIAGGAMLFVLVALGPGTDVVAHLGGFVTGLLLGALLSLVPELPQRRLLDLATGLVFAALVIGTWLLALTRTG